MAEGPFGAYQMMGRVGVGATSTVWKAVQPDLGRDVAIKELDASLLDNPEDRDRLRNEARSLAALDHPNIVRVYDYVEDTERAWLVEEWVDGAGLDAVVSCGRLAPEQAVGVLRGALAGLGHVHAAGIVHGDLTPANVLVDRSGTSKLVDFGLAAPVGDVASSEPSAVRGTPGYVAPEVIDHRPKTAAADVYSAGVILYELLSGTRLFTGDSPARVIAAQRRANVPMVHGVGDALNDLVRRATSIDPTERPADAAAFLAELEDAASDHYGPAWLDASSIAGAVAATLGTAALTTSGAEAPYPVTDAAIQEARAVVAASGDRAAAPPARGRVFGRTKWSTVAAGAAAVVAATVAIVVALSGSDPGASSGALDTTPIAQSSATDPPTTVGPTTVLTTAAPTTVAPTTTTVRPAEVVANRFAGTYQTTSVVTDGNGSTPVGQTSTFELVLVADCSAADCAIRIDNSRSAVQGNTLQFAGTITEPCTSDPAITVTDAWKTILTATKRADDQRVTTLEGSQTLTVIDLGGCAAEIDPVTTSWVATR